MENTTLYVKIPQVHFFIDKNQFNLARELKECQGHQIPKSNLNTYALIVVGDTEKEEKQARAQPGNPRKKPDSTHLFGASEGDPRKGVSIQNKGHTLVQLRLN